VRLYEFSITIECIIPVSVERFAGHSAFIWHVTPVESPNDFRSWNSHGSAVDDESEFLVMTSKVLKNLQRHGFGERTIEFAQNKN
jgi:hypothetical protein